MAFSIWILLLVSYVSFLTAGQSTVTFPTGVEVDIIIPRNDTYNPVSPFPIAFAIQNSPVAWNFGFRLKWELQTVGSNGAGYDFGQLDSGLSDIVSPSDPYILVQDTLELILSPYAPELPHTWRLDWTFGFYSMCSQSDDLTNITTGATNIQGTVYFTSHVGGRNADVAAGPNGTNEYGTKECSLLGGLVAVQANLTGCPQVGDPGALQSDPCAINLDDAAKSISASVTATTTMTTSSATASGSVAGASSTPASATTTSSVGVGTSNGADSFLRAALVALVAYVA